MSRTLPPALLLFTYAILFGLRSLGGGVLVFDDHPGQLYRLYHVVTLGWAPWRLNPGWWAGYAELQYYPPGAAWLGALIHTASFGALGVERSYEAVLWIAWMLPGIATFALLTRVLGNGWLALPGAFMALTLSAGSRSGVEEGLRWGLVAARLGWGVLPLVALSLVSWVEGARRFPLGAAPLIAAAILLHPAHAPAAVLMLILATWFGEGATPRRIAQAAGVAALALGLAAVWLLPLLVHLRMALPLAWGDSSPSGLLWQLARPLVVVMIVTQAAAWISMRRAGGGRSTERWLHALTPAMAALVALDSFVAQARGILWLPADRLVDSLLLAVIIGAAQAAPRLAARFPRQGAPAVAAVLLLPALLLSGGSPEPALTLWPARGQWPRYDEVVRGTKVDALWRALHDAPPGRVLFLRSGLALDYRPEWWRAHSHITALTPVRTGRGILHGTFTHPSPVAGLVYSGSATPRPITELAEQRDGLTLFGQPLPSMTEARFEKWMDTLGISAVVTSEADVGKLAFLASGKHFAPARVIGPFRVYFAREGRTLPEPAGPQVWRLVLSPGGAGWRPTGFAYSPLWTASREGHLADVYGHEGMLWVTAPAAGGSITLRHQPGTAEVRGVWISALSVVAFAAFAVAELFRRRGPSGLP